MSRLFTIGFIVVVVLGGWYFLTHFDIQGLDSLSVEPRTGGSEGGSQPGEGLPDEPPVPQKQSTIRVATMNLGPLDRNKLAKPHVAARLADLVRRFDVVAVQDVRAPNQGLLVEFVELINAEGRFYDFATPPSVGRDPVEQYSAFLFDRATVQIDRSTVYVVEDPAGRFRREPLVASFRARGPDAAEAFTFTLVNVHTDPAQAATELDLLDDAFRAVAGDGRGEDDVIVLGDLGADDRHLGELGNVANISCAISGLPSTTRGTRLVDNILFDRRASTEFIGRSGAVDLIREFNLSMREAVEVSDHLPVWAEFSVFEGGQAGHVARTPP